MNRVFNINNGWYYNPTFEKSHEAASIDESFERVNLPHANIELPYHYFDETSFQFVSCYKYPLALDPMETEGKQVFLRFEGVMAYARVFVNGHFVGEHKGGYTPFKFKIDEFLSKDGDNVITVMVDSTEREDIPPFGGQIDYLTYGGIYRGVSIGIYDDLFIENIKIETLDVLSEDRKVLLKVFLDNHKLLESRVLVNAAIKDNNGSTIAGCKKEFELSGNVGSMPKAQHVLDLTIEDIPGIKLWDLDSPELYTMSVRIETENIIDEYSDTFGFRSAEFRADGFWLNGRNVKLKGLNRHQSYPYVGYAMPARAQQKDAEILKNELHLNLVRTSHYPQLKEFIYKCDSIGLLVFEEIPGWQHIGNQEWKEVAKENVREMVMRDWNHPSIILWGVRVNESPDDDLFYSDTNSIAHALDESRQTGGVRYIKNSRLLEDVYTFNDFNHDGIAAPLQDQQAVTGLDRKVPYMVTEYNGHMYPTKRFDQEERQMEHALRHLRVQNAAFADPSISGAIGWCMFDYNTHKDFGSGDRICHHGVMDMFRIPKLAAYAYQSQVSPKLEPVLEPVSFWARGERSIGGAIPMVVFTNCDYIEFQYGNLTHKKIYPNREAYQAVEYPPVIIDYSVIKPEESGSWGMKWENAMFRGYHDGKLVIEKTLSCAPLPCKLSVTVDDMELSSLEKDATRVVVKLLDQCGNLLPFADHVISVTISGPARIQGPDTFALKGGCAGFWIETKNEPGEILVSVKSHVLDGGTLRIQVK